MIGKKISHYEITERLGAGGMGVVYKAVDPRLDRTVAIKFLGASLSGDSVAKQRFIQEAKSASALDHPNICSIYEIDEDEQGNLFMVMALYAGKPLDDVIDGGPLSVGEALGVTIQVADGLAKAHSKAIVHRDIKPANVILTEDGIAKILDFGLAKMHGATSLTQSGQSVGTPAYMAPEHLKDNKVDHRGDIWALGVMLYELMTGTRPFAADHPQAVMYQVVNEEPRSLLEVFPEAPAGVWEVIARCLEKEPDERYQQVAEVRDDLRLILKRLEASSDASLSSQDAFASSVNVALRMKPVRTTNYGRTFGRIAAALGVLGVLGGGVYGGMKLFAPKPGDALRVLVMAPEVEAAESSAVADQAVSTVEVALVRGLNDMRGVVPVEGSNRDGASIVELVDAAAADHAVSVVLRDAGAEWQVSMKKLAPDGTVEWAGDFPAPHEDPLVLANAALLHLSKAFPDHSLRDAIDVRPADYAAYVRQYQAFYRDSEAAESMLDSLAAIQKGSPDFVEAFVLESVMARTLFDVTREVKYLERARTAAENALHIAPDDPRPSSRLFDIAMSIDDLETAKSAAADLDRLQPGSVEKLRRDALIAEKEGDMGRALSLMNKAVMRRPARSYLVELVILEYNQGLNDEARNHLEMILERFPEDDFARSKLAELELLYGSAERARDLYQELVNESGGAVELTNLGLAQELLGEYATAASSLERAVASTPDHPSAVLNLADCEKMAGNESKADSLYAAVITLIAKDSNPDDLSNLRMKAQSLAHTGQHREAVATIQSAIAKDAGNAWTLYAAALVYATVGETTSALVHAQNAAAKGVEGRWFQLSFFEPLRADPAFQNILAADPIVSKPE